MVNIGRHFPRATSAKILAACTNMCCTHVMSQFVLKTENLSHIIGRNDGRLRSPFPTMAPGFIHSGKSCHLYLDRVAPSAIGCYHRELCLHYKNSGIKEHGERFIVIGYFALRGHVTSFL